MGAICVKQQNGGFKMKKVLTLCLALCLMLSATACSMPNGSSSDSDYDNDYSSDYDSDYGSDYDSDYDYTPSMSESEAIAAVKNDSGIAQKIANLYGLKFFYQPDYGTCTATQNYSGGWSVTLKGTISGYTDDYKTNFSYDNKFTVKASVSDSGYVSGVYASKY